MPTSPAQTIVAAYAGNPFDIDAGTRRAAARALAELDVKRALSDAVAAGDIDGAKSLVLAVGHAQACTHPGQPARVLDARLIPTAVWAKLPRRRGEYLRIVMAAGRCYEALTAIRGVSAAMQRARREAWAACFGDSLRNALELEQVIRDHDILLLGETGTGKEVFARALQLATPGDADGGPAPAAAINAAAIPETLVESELFGHVKGAFTGADDARTGRLRSAHGGSFFLDEVGDLPSTTQVKLLRVIETNEVYPLGSDRSHTVELRYVAATHKDLESMVERREFRSDLFQRLAGNIIRIPPLRERPDDIEEIGVAFVRSYVGERGVDRIAAWLRSDQARGYAWPGNVRELQNALRNLMLGLEPDLAAEAPAATVAGELPEAVAGCAAPMAEVSDWYLQRVLAACDGNYTQAARVLEIDRSTVRRRATALARRRRSSR